ncbi:MAG: LlaJI family restriction endonuclease [Fusobacteriaceae bacterium]
MNQQQFEIVNDGQTADKGFVQLWDISDYCNVYNGTITISFVGIIIKNGRILFSFPKHYCIPNEMDNIISCMKQILYILSKNKATYGSFDKGLKGEFPIKAYIGILRHYKKYGLYVSNEKYYETGFMGNIDWNKTINQSNKVVQDKGIVYFPFVIKKTRDKQVFISECMKFVLSDANKYKDFVATIITYDDCSRDKTFSNLRYILNELKKLSNIYFKDIEKKLIENLISYVEWKSRSKDNVRLLTLKFENYWESMIHDYINDNFFEIKDDVIIWQKGLDNKFSKPKMENIESISTMKNAVSREPYKIKYDHLSIDNINEKIIIFDSKYFNDEVSKLNYKQLFYHYNLKQKYPEYVIDNGLLLPTEKDYYTRVHINRTDLDGIKIIEHYINLNMVLDYYYKKI